MLQTITTGYRPQAEDTSIESDVYLFDRLRSLSLTQRIEQAAAHDRAVRKLCLAGIKSRCQNLPIEEIGLHFARAVLAEKFSPGFKPSGTDERMWIQDSIALAQELHQILVSLDIPYYVGGGVASTIHGEPRSTRDLDLVIQIQQQQIDSLVRTLEEAGFYCPAGAVEELKFGRSKILNITHTQTIANADLYAMDSSPFAVSQMSRRQLLDVEGMPNFWIASPEDTILQKLLWGYRSQSEKQWRDVLGMLKLQNTNLDYNYLTEWATALGITDPLAQAMTEAGIQSR
jgi:hypothetical protein